MRRFFQFLFRFRVFILFLLLEGIGFWLIVNNNPYQGSIYFNSSNSITASVLEVSNGITGYFDLREENTRLIEENKLLRQKGFNLIDTADFVQANNNKIALQPAKVINKSLFFQNNYITIDLGSNDGVAKGMGVIGPMGVVGMVQSVSANYSSVFSLLHSSILISSVHKKSMSLCTTKWDGMDPGYSKIEYLPRHVQISVGDTITTSGYNSVFPENIMVGIVDKISIDDNATFYNITIKNATDFYTLSYVYLVSNFMKHEKDSLEMYQAND